MCTARPSILLPSLRSHPQRACGEMAEEARRHREASAVRENHAALVQQRVKVVENELEQVCVGGGRGGEGFGGAE